jgi:hypothetical protein
MLNAIIEIDALPDVDWFRLAPFLQPVCHIAEQDRFMVGLATINDNPRWSATSLESVAKKSLCSGEISPLAKPEINSVTGAIAGAVKILPLATDLDICVIDMPLASDRALAEVELLQQGRGLVIRPALDGGTIHRHAAFGHWGCHVWMAPVWQYDC